MMDPLSLLGLGVEGIKAIRSLIKGNVSVAPNVIEFPSSEWDAVHEVVICNNKDLPLFDVQIAIWQKERQPEKDLALQILEVEDQNKGITADLGGISVATGIYVFGGEANGRPVMVLNLDRLDPKKCRQILLKASHGNLKKVNIEVVRFSKQPSRHLEKPGQAGILFKTPPFKMQIRWMSTLARRKK